jgi:hypothetical protein
VYFEEKWRIGEWREEGRMNERGGRDSRDRGERREEGEEERYLRREEKGEIAWWCLDGDRMPVGGKACTVYFEEIGE